MKPKTFRNSLFPFLLSIMIIPLLAADTKTQNVVVCMGKNAKVYHASSNCSGLRNCRGGVKTVTLKEAQDMGRRACKICY
ncbi:hypothetical protein Barb6XT_02969 [Bacteroidales bacterium Barb6XT]|nr:hypothetical protein Barb6XT_02969 [Bacteroidales bacterium Barb6XT]